MASPTIAIQVDSHSALRMSERLYASKNDTCDHLVRRRQQEAAVRVEQHRADAVPEAEEHQEA